MEEWKGRIGDVPNLYHITEYCGLSIPNQRCEKISNVLFFSRLGDIIQAFRFMQLCKRNNLVIWVSRYLSGEGGL